MKIRILDNSIRVRVSIVEMKLLAEGNSINSSTIFPGSSLTTKILPIESKSFSIDFAGGTISILIPVSTLQKLYSTDEVGFNHDFTFSNGNLNLLFEKDFQCLTDRAEDQSGLFKNPKDSH